MDRASENGADSEHTGIGFARNKTGSSAQHLDGGDSQGRSSPFDPFAYDYCHGELGLGDWFYKYDFMDEYLDFLAGSAGDPPVRDTGIDTAPDNHV